MRLERWQLRALVLLGCVLGGVLVLAQQLTVAYVWLKYVNPITTGLPASSVEAIVFGVILVTWRSFLQLFTGFLLGGLTTYVWLQSTTNPSLAIRASLRGGLLLAVLIFFWGPLKTLN